MGKDAEKRVVEIANHYGWYRHKYGDVRYCIHCHKPQPKSERAPDYAVAPIATWVEAKNNDAKGRWSWIELLADGDRSNQRDWLLEKGGWLFIELGLGRAPNGKGAWLVPFKLWVEQVEPVLLEKGMRSLRYTQKQKAKPGADEFLHKWALAWETNVGWTIPDGHVWWRALADRTEDLLLEVLPKCQN